MMNQLAIIQQLRALDDKGRCVFTIHVLRKFFPKDSAKTFSEGLARMVKVGILIRACRGVYVNPHAKSLHSRLIEEIAIALRPGEYNYISLESMLSEYGAISQIPIDRLTVMTTGRAGVHKTLYGIIEFTHTKRRITDLLKNLKRAENRPLRFVSSHIAWRDLKRVGRNVELVNTEDFNFD